MVAGSLLETPPRRANAAGIFLGARFEAKREMFDRLATHLSTLADQVEMAMLERKTGTSS